MVRVSCDEFLTKVATLYDEPRVAGRKGTVAISCKSGGLERQIFVDYGSPTNCCVVSNQLVLGGEEKLLLFRAVRYGNNKHKTKYSALVRYLI